MTAQRILEDIAKPEARLSALFVITGDDPLLTIEAADTIRLAARQAGYNDRKALVMDARSDWTEVALASQSGSLFGDRQLLEISIPTGKPGKSGADTLLGLAKTCQGVTDADVLTIISLPRLDKLTRDTKWAQSIFAAGTTLDLPNIERVQLPKWIAERLARQKQQAQATTLQWLADKVEGNLLAAHQEILKLGLLYPEGTLSTENVEQAVMNVARYDVFGLRDAMLAGDAQRMLRMLAGLQAEGEALPLVLWAIGEEIRSLTRVANAVANGLDPSGILRSLRFFGAHERLARQAIARVPLGQWAIATQHAHEVDRIIKGIPVPGRLHDPWEEMARLAMRIAAGPSNR